MKLYHGSSVAALTELKPLSRLHGAERSEVLYLTCSIPYALFYIWDSTHNKTSRKYVTCGLNGGVVTYEEQFPDQLKAFYQGVSGYLYAVSPGPGVEAVANREATFFSRQAVPVTDMIFIPDVYDAILHYEQTGSIRIVRYHEMPQEKLQAIHDHITQWIAARDLPAQPETELARFYAAHFPVLWENASKSAKTP